MWILWTFGFSSSSSSSSSFFGWGAENLAHDKNEEKDRYKDAKKKNKKTKPKLCKIRQRGKKQNRTKIQGCGMGHGRGTEHVRECT